MINQLSQEVGRIVAFKEVSDMFIKQGATPLTNTPQVFEKLVHAKIATRRQVFAAAGLKPE